MASPLRRYSLGRGAAGKHHQRAGAYGRDKGLGLCPLPAASCGARQHGRGRGREGDRAPLLCLCACGLCDSAVVSMPDYACHADAAEVVCGSNVATLACSGRGRVRPRYTYIEGCSMVLVVGSAGRGTATLLVAPSSRTRLARQVPRPGDGALVAAPQPGGCLVSPCLARLPRTLRATGAGRGCQPGPSSCGIGSRSTLALINLNELSSPRTQLSAGKVFIGIILFGSLAGPD